jgi:predicted short-subunit dehydrogenase-like oxidoreductase (DUF2520 family)
LNRIAIIGSGKLGTHLYYALKKNAVITGVIKSSRSRYDKGIISKADIIFICTQDSKIHSAAGRLVSTGCVLKGKYVFHTSGSLHSGKLDELKAIGAHTGSFHPVQTFEQKARKNENRFKGIYAAVEGTEKAASKGKQLARLLGARPFVISRDNKVFHHLCCVMSSNYISALVKQVEKTGGGKIKINGFNKHRFFSIYMPLAVQSLKNASEKGAAGSLSGPIERNDSDTIRAHINALKKGSKDALAVYLLMGIETVKLALEKKSISSQDAGVFLNLFSKHINKQ